MAKNEDVEKFVTEKFNIEAIENENILDKIDYEKLVIEYIRNRYFEAASEETVVIDLISYLELEEKEALFSIQASIKGEMSLADFFKEEIKKLEDNGMIIRNKKGRIASSEVFGIYAGKISINAKGFGFLIRDNRELGDIFVPVKNLNEAMNNDRVLVKVKDQDSFGRAGRYSKVKEGNRQEGEVIRIIERANRFVTGTYHRNKNYGFVIPDDTKILNDIYISKYNSVDLKDNFKVVVEITRWPFEGNNPEGRIVEILGHKDDAGIDILSIAKNRGLPMEFPEDALKQAEKVPEQVSEDDIANRRDLRGELIITIDGDDAKDLDDAVSLKRLSNGNYSLGVHIADVSQYVTENSPLDKEAVDRGTSVYMVDRVLPMLPPRLSNGICSLNPKVDRLTLSCNMEINQNGKVVNYEIFESVIKTAERMTYNNVNRIFDKEPEVLERYAQILDMLGEMKTLQGILNNRRTNRGSIIEFMKHRIQKELRHLLILLIILDLDSKSRQRKPSQKLFRK